MRPLLWELPFRAPCLPVTLKIFSFSMSLLFPSELRPWVESSPDWSLETPRSPPKRARSSQLQRTIRPRSESLFFKVSANSRRIIRNLEISIFRESQWLLVVFLKSKSLSISMLMVSWTSLPRTNPLESNSRSLFVPAVDCPIQISIAWFRKLKLPRRLMKLLKRSSILRTRPISTSITQRSNSRNTPREFLRMSRTKFRVISHHWTRPLSLRTPKRSRRL